MSPRRLIVDLRGIYAPFKGIIKAASKNGGGGGYFSFCQASDRIVSRGARHECPRSSASVRSAYPNQSTA